MFDQLVYHDVSPVHVVSGGGDVHHLHGAARQPEGKRPQRTLGEYDEHVSLVSLMGCCSHLSAPVDQVVHPGQSPLHLVLLEVDFEGGIAMAFNSVRDTRALQVGLFQESTLWKQTWMWVGGVSWVAAGALV